MASESAVTLVGKTALVTGAARRVGAAIARALHAKGANLVLHYRHSSTEAAQLAAELSAVRPGSVATARAELVDTAAVRELAAQAVAAFGRLDVLVNNASS